MDITNFKYNALVESIVDMLMIKTQNNNPNFFRLQTNYYLTLVPSMLGVKIDSPITGTIPINLYGVNLANSGSGKGMSTNILETQILKEFKQIFMDDLFFSIADASLDLESINRAAIMNIGSAEAKDLLEREFKSYGAYKFSFDSATAPAIKQLRNKLLLARVGAINLIIDEIGSNLNTSTDALITFLELYDKGLVKDKLIKNTDVNTRYSEMSGETPANMMLFGTPSKLLNGSKIEEDFFSFLETGYARRCFFAHNPKISTVIDKDPATLYQALANKSHQTTIDSIAKHLGSLATSKNANSIITLPDPIGIKLIEYRIFCEKRASALPEHMEIFKAELAHRYFKVLKLAGTYAFLDQKHEIELNHLEEAIKFAEDSGEALKAMMQREKPYERLAKYIGSMQGKELTQVDLTENLLFYKGTQNTKAEMLSMATAWGYTHNILIKRTQRDGVEFISGESLKETDLNNIILATSDDFAYNYDNYTASWHDPVIPELLKQPNYNWINHHLVDGHRCNDSIIPKFNMIVLDVDTGNQLQHTMDLLSEYTYIIHTTKRHGIKLENGQIHDRFRILMPMNYELKLSVEEYYQFMENVAIWLPIEGLDTSTFQPSRKWSTNPTAEIYINDGKLIDVLPFIPRTTREAEFKKSQLNLTNLSNIERWFYGRMLIGNRNNELLKYGLMLYDSGFDIHQIEEVLLDFNSRLPNPLNKSEIKKTIMTSLSNKAKYQ